MYAVRNGGFLKARAPAFLALRIFRSLSLNLTHTRPLLGAPKFDEQVSESRESAPGSRAAATKGERVKEITR